MSCPQGRRRAPRNRSARSHTRGPEPRRLPFASTGRRVRPRALAGAVGQHRIRPTQGSQKRPPPGGDPAARKVRPWHRAERASTSITTTSADATSPTPPCLTARLEGLSGSEPVLSAERRMSGVAVVDQESGAAARPPPRGPRPREPWHSATRAGRRPAGAPGASCKLEGPLQAPLLPGLQGPRRPLSPAHREDPGGTGQPPSASLSGAQRRT